jgi:hypothetical protein
MRVPAWIGCLVALLLLLPSCDPLTGRDAVGVTRVSSGASIGVVYVLCPFADVRAVALYRAPEGRPDYDPEDILWRIASKLGSKQHSYVVGVTPLGFVEDVALTADLEPAQSLTLGHAGSKQVGSFAGRPRALRGRSGVVLDDQSLLDGNGERDLVAFG